MKPRRHSYELTPAGFTFAAVTAFVLIAAINSQTNLLFFAAGLMAGAIAVSATISTVMLRKVEVVRLAADQAFAGAPLEVHYRIVNGKRTWPCFAVRITEARFTGPLQIAPDGYCLHLAARQQATVMTQLVAGRRGVLELAAVRCTCAFPFGFVRRVRYLSRPQRIVVYPRIGELTRDIALRCRDALTRGPLTSAVSGGQDEFYGLREYRPGDNIRAIHWRRTARTGELMIRELTASAPPQLIVVLDLRSWRDYPDSATRVEKAIELAAALASHGFARQYAVGLHVIGGQATPLAQPRADRQQRALVLEALATVQAQDVSTDSAEPPALRGPGRAEWILVQLGHADRTADAVPHGVNTTRLCLDDPDVAQWLHFDVPAERAASTPAPATESKR